MAKEIASRKWPKVYGLTKVRQPPDAVASTNRWLAGDIPDIVLDVPLQGVAAVGEGRVVSCPDVQFVKVLSKKNKKTSFFEGCN